MLVPRIYRQAQDWAAEHPEVDVRAAAHLGPDPRLARWVQCYWVFEAPMEPVDYPDIILPAAHAVARGGCDRVVVMYAGRVMETCKAAVGAGFRVMLKPHVDVLDGPQSVVWDEAENRLHVQKAIMAALMGGEQL